MPLRLYLIRHGETEWSLSGRHTGRTDIPLTEQGEQEARKLGERLRAARFIRVSTRQLGKMIRFIFMKGTAVRIDLPPDANCLLSIADHCFRSRDCVNLIVIDKQPELQWLDMDAAVQHCAAGASIWRWTGNDQGGDM